MDALRCRRWDEQEFIASGESWRRLLKLSNADPLFSSFEWLQSWWRECAAQLSAQPCVLGFYSGAGELVGIAPLYLRPARHAGVFAARRIELMGSVWRQESAVFSEYLDVIATVAARDAVRVALADWLSRNDEWDELVLGNVRDDSIAAALARDLGRPAHVRAMESMFAWSLALPDTFQTFAAGLASNTRRKLLHQRDKLENAQFVELPRPEWPAALDRLETLVARRWGKPVVEARRRFHADVAESLGEPAVRLSELRSSGRCVSVMLNVRAGGTEYYLQSGFVADFAHGLSPGYLHLGYAIEAACRDGIGRFDLLAGPGRHREYKRDFAPTGTRLTTFHIVRNPRLRALFRVADALRGRTDITSPT